jgi:hypothetical protein
MTAAAPQPVTAGPAPPEGTQAAAGEGLDPRFDTVIHRRPTRSVRVGATRWWCSR